MEIIKTKTGNLLNINSIRDFYHNTYSDKYFARVDLANVYEISKETYDLILSKVI